MTDAHARGGGRAGLDEEEIAAEGAHAQRESVDLDEGQAERAGDEEQPRPGPGQARKGVMSRAIDQ
ncbi:hypothetical protein [Streptomyces sp. NPDC046727]|uniref:hypothetical protein n=1 Tax=Streptomyces sp. NPDC046727 TaxID=3155373 RepID=UPI0034050E72